MAIEKKKGVKFLKDNTEAGPAAIQRATAMQWSIERSSSWATITITIVR